MGGVKDVMEKSRNETLVHRKVRCSTHPRNYRETQRDELRAATDCHTFPNPRPYPPPIICPCTTRYVQINALHNLPGITTLT